MSWSARGAELIILWPKRLPIRGRTNYTPRIKATLGKVSSFLQPDLSHSHEWLCTSPATTPKANVWRRCHSVPFHSVFTSQKLKQKKKLDTAKWNRGGHHSREWPCCTHRKKCPEWDLRPSRSARYSTVSLESKICVQQRLPVKSWLRAGYLIARCALEFCYHNLRQRAPQKAGGHSCYTLQSLHRLVYETPGFEALLSITPTRNIFFLQNRKLKKCNTRRRPPSSRCTKGSYSSCKNKNDIFVSSKRGTFQVIVLRLPITG